MMKKYLPLNKKGASSVLIIMMMVVLIVFGLAALTTSLAAMRLGDKSNDWTSEYYELETSAEEFLFNLDGLLIQAELDVISYIEEGLYLDNEKTLFPDNIQETIYNSYNFALPESARSHYLSSVMKAAFYKSAIDALLNEYPRARFTYSGGYMRQILEDEEFTNITFAITISEEGSEYPKNLDIELRLVAPKYNITISENIVSGTRRISSFKRYEILTWKEWQEYFDYSDKIEFDDIFDQPNQ
ncbi:MAG: hypothetical protein KAH14_05500 [Clostridiales bacterium]|nr:hypothetical protein [Clostridiales bacterium]